MRETLKVVLTVIAALVSFDAGLLFALFKGNAEDAADPSAKDT